MQYTSVKQYVAVKPLHFSKVEAKVQSGIATIAQKRDVVQVDLVMDYEYEGKRYYAGFNKVILLGDSALAPWNKTALCLDGKDFVLCPIAAVLGFVGPDPVPQVVQINYPGLSPVPWQTPAPNWPPTIITCDTNISYEGLK